ncbi:MAG: ABC transporter permease [Gammaproteobacteria bacterium]|nr:ABC transporter permease [Gammaproteobacteria bacterium]
MNNQIITVTKKEIIDNVRDRKTLISSIFMGAIFMPIIFVVMMNYIIGMQQDKAESQLEMTIMGIENAESFISFIKTKDVKIKEFSGNAKQAIETKAEEAVIIIPESFAEDFSEGIPAKIEIYYDATAKGAVNVTQRRIKSLIREYSRIIGLSRLQLRGISPIILNAVFVEDHDVSTAQSKGAQLMTFLPYALILGLFMGSMYLAIDTMAGEKERNSLESLLLNPIKRSHLLIGKLFATISFGLMTMTITLITFKLVMPFMPLEELGMTLNLGFKNITILTLVLAPLAVLAGSLQTIVATFSKSFKEAQTYVNLLIFVPMIPSMALMLMPVKEKLWMMSIPVLSQNLVINQIMRGEPVTIISIIVTIVSSLVVGIIFALAAIKLYNRESLLFSN